MPSAPTPNIWARLISPAVDAVSDAAPRALVVGNAGSGKSATLRHLHTLLTESRRDALYVRPGGTDLAVVPPSLVLIVDDLHRVAADQLATLRTRAADPDAALIVALRPETWEESIADIARQLERDRPSVVLGHVSRSDVLTYLAGHDLVLSDTCVNHILAITGGVSWLVSEALRAHDERDCRGDATHRELRTVLEERIAHRMNMIPPSLREEVERICIDPLGQSSASVRPDDHVRRGYAEGLLLRSGQPVPLVRETVQATIPVARLIALSSVSSESSEPGDTAELAPRALGETLVHHADLLLPTHPLRAAELYQGAIRSGVPAASLAGYRAEAAWASGDVDAASALIDAAGYLDKHSSLAKDSGLDKADRLDHAGSLDKAGRSDPPRPERTATDAERDRLADTAAAVWSARGMMQQAHAVYLMSPPSNPISGARAMVAELGVGQSVDDQVQAASAPSTLGVAMSLLRRGLKASLAPDQSEAALADLVRASEMYSRSHSAAAIPELPAVIAAIVALNLGSVTTARSVIGDALAQEHGGAWARPRLLLWRAWIAVQLARPTEARAALAEAHAASTPRDVLLARAVEVAIARRYEDAAGLESAWKQARASLLRVDVDLYLLHPLAELISSATRTGDAERIRPQFARALAIVDRLGNPPLWSAHLHWAGIQNGILLGSPESLRPHARALVAAAASSRVAATMAGAGRLWTSVLGGTVDADAVEKAARELASVGLTWDAARLAGHGAARSQDRKVSARLLACARELHPIDGSRRAIAAGVSDAQSTATPPQEMLSERELEVARLVVEGKTYAEIGETIFISPRTAEHHIAHIRRRLGANSRSEVIAKLRQLIGTEQGRQGPVHPHPGDADAPP